MLLPFSLEIDKSLANHERLYDLRSQGDLASGDLHSAYTDVNQLAVQRWISAITMLLATASAMYEEKGRWVLGVIELAERGGQPEPEILSLPGLGPVSPSLCEVKELKWANHNGNDCSVLELLKIISGPERWAHRL